MASAIAVGRRPLSHLRVRHLYGGLAQRASLEGLEQSVCSVVALCATTQGVWTLQTKLTSQNGAFERRVCGTANNCAQINGVPIGVSLAARVDPQWPGATKSFICCRKPPTSAQAKQLPEAASPQRFGAPPPAPGGHSGGRRRASAGQRPDWSHVANLGGGQHPAHPSPGGVLHFIGDADTRCAWCAVQTGHTIRLLMKFDLKMKIHCILLC